MNLLSSLSSPIRIRPSWVPSTLSTRRLLVGRHRCRSLLTKKIPTAPASSQAAAVRALFRIWWGVGASSGSGSSLLFQLDPYSRTAQKAVSTTSGPNGPTGDPDPISHMWQAGRPSPLELVLGPTRWSQNPWLRGGGFGLDSPGVMLKTNASFE